MDFFEHQERARRLSRRMVWLVALAVLGVLFVLHLLGGTAWLMLAEEPPAQLSQVLLEPRLLLATLVFGGGIILVGTLVKLHSLRGGGAAVARAMGGTEIRPDTGSFAERRLHNVVEEMALAAGIRVPQVFVLRQEKGLNAFAAGYSPDDAAVAVTQGLLDTLNRAELQAVIGHEFSHILNGDMRLNIRLIGVLGGILCISVAGRLIMETAVRSLRYSSGRRSRDKKDDGAAAVLFFVLLGLAVWIIGSVGVFFGRLLQSAISRQREYLADASAIQFTRDPTALANALKIIGAVPQGARVRAGRATEVSHMLFASGMASLFATHPPLVRRIRRIEPAFDGNFSAVGNLLAARKQTKADETDRDEDSLAFGGVLHQALRATEATAGDLPSAWLAPEERAALRDPAEAIGCIYGALLAPEGEPQLRERQTASIAAAHGAHGQSIVQAATGWQRRHRDRTARQRRMACELAAEQLRHHPAEEREQIVAQITTLSHLDGSVDDFEFALGYLIRRRLSPEPAEARMSSLPPAALAGEISLVLSMLAHTGQTNPQDAAAAWEAGTRGLADPADGASLFPGIAFDPDALDDLAAIENALERLIRLTPICKRELLDTGMRIIRHDHTITDAEENMIAAIADAIHAYGWQIAA
ncbi:MAG: M48 family metallopeptidase [Kiritimatiellia bacterium]|jgi:Zn-dependent protease with chaperone function